MAPDASSQRPGQALSDATLPVAGTSLRLLDLRRGQVARVQDLSVESGLQHRLQALGLRPGQRLQVLRRAPWGGPIHLQVGMTELMLRRRDAARIAVTLASLQP